MPVGLPAADPATVHVGSVAALVGATVLPNVMLSNLHDREALAGRLGARRTLGLAGAILLAGFAAALAALATA